MPDFNHAYIGNLVIQAQSGSGEAFAELYATTFNHIYNYSRHYLRDDYMAQDAVQETYISALKNINNLKDPSLFIAWLNQICFHVCYDMTRKNRPDTISSELMELILDDTPEHNPDENYEDKEEIDAVKRAVQSLPFLEQQVIVMRFYNEMKLEDIAAALSCSRSSIKRYINSGKKLLAKKLRKEGGQS
ncbi:MAG: sigma-70 family RNA polymerase sigma factor [Lachnospiraceae bacterium]|nr:sigma-70 family RNA polymerase sigma factor [Lachnospiraceae bacterium]